MPWEKYEVVLLLDTYLKISRKELSWKQAAASLSNLLRSLADKKGRQVNHSFRSVPEIHLELLKMEYLYTDGHKGLSGRIPDKTYSEIVNLYKNDHSKFSEVLQSIQSREDIEISEAIIEDDATEKIMNQNLHELGLSEDIVSALNGVGINTVKDIMSREQGQWENIPHFTLGMFNIMTKALKNKGLSYNVEFDPFKYTQIRMQWSKEKKSSEKKSPKVNRSYHKPIQLSPLFIKKEEVDNHIHDKKIDTKKEENIAASLASESMPENNVQNLNKNITERIPESVREHTSVTLHEDINYFMINGEKVIKNKKALMEYAARQYCITAKSIKAFIKKYNGLLSALGVEYNPNFIITDSQLVEFICYSPYVKYINGKIKWVGLDSAKKLLPSNTVTTHSEIEKRPEANAVNKNEEKGEIVQRIKAVCKDYFVHGYSCNLLTFKRFCRVYLDKYGEAFPAEKNELEKILADIGFLYKKNFFIPDFVLCEQSRHELETYICYSFEKGITSISYQALFDYFRDSFINRNDKIISPEMLCMYLKKIVGNTYAVGERFISLNRETQNVIHPEQDIQNCLKINTLPMSVADIAKKLPNLGIEEIQQYMRKRYGILGNGGETYFYADAFEFDENQLVTIKNMIQQELDDAGLLTYSDLIKMIELRMPNLAEALHACYTEIGIRNLIRYKFQGQFSFTRICISRPGGALTSASLCGAFAKRRKKFSLQEISEFADEMKMQLNFDEVYKYSIRTNEQDFIDADQISWDTTAADNAIARICSRPYITLREFDRINLYNLLPYIGTPWNIYILEYYVAFKSQHFSLMHTKFSVYEVAGVIVSNLSSFKTLDDVMVDALRKARIPLNENDALSFLVDNGYLPRRRYKNISDIIKRIKLSKQ